MLPTTKLAEKGVLFLWLSNPVLPLILATHAYSSQVFHISTPETALSLFF